MSVFIKQEDTDKKNLVNCSIQEPASQADSPQALFSISLGYTKEGQVNGFMQRLRRFARLNG